MMKDIKFILVLMGTSILCGCISTIAFLELGKIYNMLFLAYFTIASAWIMVVAILILGSIFIYQVSKNPVKR